MRFWHLLIFCVLAGTGSAFADPAPSALAALKAVPKTAWDRLAMVAGFEGQPAPDRWHFLMFDPTQANGVREYVVVRGELGASRSLSQFAETLHDTEVFGAGAIKVDSDQAARLAEQYAQANGLKIVSFNFELRKAGDETGPLWRVTGRGADGETVGTLVLTAAKGTIISHEGFATEPSATAEHSRTDHATKPARESGREEVAEVRHALPGREVPVATPLPASPDEAEHRPGFLHRASGSLQRIFTGRE